MTHRASTNRNAGRVTGLNRRWRTLVVPLAVVAVLSACAENEDVLPGERFDLRDFEGLAEAAENLPLQSELPPGPQPVKRSPEVLYAVAGEPQAIRLPQAESLTAWPLANQNTANRVPHARLRDGPLTRVWSAPIGSGNSRRLRIPTGPIAADGRVFTLDATLTLSAFSAEGVPFWTRPMTPATETPGEVQGGGLAWADGSLFVVTGYGTLTRLDAATGGEQWIHRFDAAATAPPVVSGGLVYLVTRDGVGWALDADIGKVIWQVEGTTTAANMLSTGAPAVAGRAVLLPYPSGELSAVFRQAGIGLWTSSVAGGRDGFAFGGIGGVSGGPVVAGNTIYVSTIAGRLAALDSSNGARRWTALEGSTGTPLVTGGSIFMVSDQGELLRLDASDGGRIWSASLPFYQTDRVSRRKDVFVHYGPILAGGRLIIASTDGLLREIDPSSGALLRETDLGDPAAAAPIIANNTLYVVTANGALHAFR